MNVDYIIVMWIVYRWIDFVLWVVWILCVCVYECCIDRVLI